MKLSYISVEQWKKIGKTVGYLAVSSLIGALLAAISNDPKLFGVYTPIVNILLVTLKQAFTDPEA